MTLMIFDGMAGENVAWISVHDTVNGAKLRKLAKRLKCSKSEALGILNFLWFWGVKNSDKYGELSEVELSDVEEAVIGNTSIPSSDVVAALLETGWLDQTEDGTIYLHDWDTWQKQLYKAKERQEADAERKRLSRIAKRNHDQTELEPPGEEPEEPPAPPPEEKPKRKRNDYPVPFQAFWDAYPRQIGKGDAYKKYQARLKDGYTDYQLLSAAQNYASVCSKKKTEQEYIKHPKTFLSDSLPFLDYLPKDPAQPMSEEDNPFSEYTEE